MSSVLENKSSEVNWPVDRGVCEVPYKVFTNEQVYEREQEKIFRGDNWSFVAIEAEIPNSGDYKTTFIGDTPVIVMRDEEGQVNVVVNSCAHRGAAVCRELRGNKPNLECVYHQWAYNLKGDLIGVPFRRGIQGNGGMPKGFKMQEHSLKKLRVDSVAGLVFATFSETVGSLEDYLGPMTVTAIKRICNKPIKILGDQRQYIRGNWKLYAENTRDPYHASLLHLFHMTFGLYRSSQKGVSHMDDSKRHSMLTAIKDSDDSTEDFKNMRSFNTEFKLEDPSLLAGRKEFDDDVSLVILTVFPNLVLQQIANTLAVRQTCTKGVDGFELVWTQFGFEDDDEEMQAIRLKQGNLIGPAGLISMEDGEAVEIVHDSVIREQDKSSYIAMGGGKAENVDHLVSEGTIVGFWKYYRETMGY